MAIKKIFKIILIIVVIFFILNYFSLLFHKKQDNNIDFENLYKSLNNIEQREKTFAEFIKYGRKSGDYLSEKLTTEKDELIRIDALQVIGFVGCTNCEDSLLVFLNDSNWRVRFFALETLEKLKYREIASLLPDIIKNDSDRRVKIKAIMALGKYGNTLDIVFLEELSNQKEFKNKNLNKAINMAILNLKSRHNRI